MSAIRLIDFRKEVNKWRKICQETGQSFTITGTIDVTDDDDVYCRYSLSFRTQTDTENIQVNCTGRVYRLFVAALSGFIDIADVVWTIRDHQGEDLGSISNFQGRIQIAYYFVF